MALARTEDPAVASARERVQALCLALRSPGEPAVRLIETHISWVLLTDTLAFKLKKPVRLPFLDFSSLAARRHFCEEELRLNRRLAPSIYIDVVDVCDGPQGLQLGGPGLTLDVALRMRRFPDGALWSERLAAGELAPTHIDAMARRLDAFHRSADVAAVGSGFGSAAHYERVRRGLVEGLDAWCAMPGAAPEAVTAWAALRAWLATQGQALAPVWEARLRAGRVREGHGDLHLANVLQHGDAALAFDCIEFDPDLRWIDVLDDIAFLAADLLVHEQRQFAFRFINAYLEASGDYDGLPALRYFMVCRALVRARVLALTAAQGAAPATRYGPAQYLVVAASLAGGVDPRLAITHGLPGSGKSFASQAVLEHAGAIRARSDVERKRLFGLAALESSRQVAGGGIYGEAATIRTYDLLYDVARIALGAGWPMIVDAAFLRRSERARFAALADEQAVPFALFDCQAPVALLRQRLAQRQARGGDASEADEQVLERLLRSDEPLDEHEAGRAIVIDAAHPWEPAALARRWLERR